MIGRKPDSSYNSCNALSFSNDGVTSYHIRSNLTGKDTVGLPKFALWSDSFLRHSLQFLAIPRVEVLCGCVRAVCIRSIL